MLRQTNMMQITKALKFQFQNLSRFILKFLSNRQEYLMKNLKNLFITIQGTRYLITILPCCISNYAIQQILLCFTYTTVKTWLHLTRTQLDLDFDPINIDIQSDNSLGQRNDKKVLKVGKSDVDMNIPDNPNKNPNIYALIIGNEDYSSYQTGLNNEVNVDFAVNDAKIFKEYLIKSLGVPEENVTLKTNATLGQMKQSIQKLTKLDELSGGKAEIIFYYSGHGLPDEESKEAYIMPVDISGMEVKSAIKLNDLYVQLNQFPSKRVTVILDACFSGGARNASLVAMKGVKVKAKDQILGSNMVVLLRVPEKNLLQFIAKNNMVCLPIICCKNYSQIKGMLTTNRWLNLLPKR